MRYNDALAQARSGKALFVSNAGGRKRYAKFAEVGDDVEVALFQTVIAVHHKDGSVTVSTGGYNTATTREALNAVTPFAFHTVNGVLQANGHPMKDGMRLRAGEVLDPGSQDIPLNLAVRGMTHRSTSTVCFGVDKDTGQIVSKLGRDYAWPVVDFAAMGPHNNFSVGYDLEIIPEREVPWDYRPAVLGKQHISPEIRQQHEMFWLNARGGVTA